MRLQKIVIGCEKYGRCLLTHGNKDAEFSVSLRGKRTDVLPQGYQFGPLGGTKFTPGKDTHIKGSSWKHKI